MRILALETSSSCGAVALLEKDAVLAQADLAGPRRAAGQLVPVILQQLQQLGWRPQHLDLIAVTIGPGSFTGLRVGVTTAKTFAYAADAQILGVDTLLPIAEQALQANSPPPSADRAPAPAQCAHAILNAQRGQFFTARFHRDPQGHAAPADAARLLDPDQWLGSLSEGDLVAGPGLRPLLERIPQGVLITPAQLWLPQAATVGKIAYRHYLAGRRDDLWRLTPQYGRPSAAEEKLARREQSKLSEPPRPTS